MNRPGFVKLFRSLLDHPVWKSKAERRCVAVGLLLAANHQDKKWFDGAAYVDVRRGEVIGSRSTLAAICRVSEQEFRSALPALEKVGFLTSTATSRYTCISITNYGRYQNSKSDTNQDPTRRFDGKNEVQAQNQPAP